MFDWFYWGYMFLQDSLNYLMNMKALIKKMWDATKKNEICELTLSRIMLKNGQTYFQNLVGWTPQNLYSMFDHFLTFCMKELNDLSWNHPIIFINWLIFLLNIPNRHDKSTRKNISLISTETKTRKKIATSFSNKYAMKKCINVP